MKMLIIGRAFQGTAGGGLVQLVYITISDLYSLQSRTIYLGFLQLVWAIAGGVGPVVGGSLAEFVGWRWTFWINLPVSGATFLLLMFLDVHNPKTELVEGIKAIDWFGSLSLLGLMVMLLLGLNFGGATFPWNSPTVICLIVFGVLMSVFFVFSEKQLARYPLMPLKLFRHKSNIAALVVGFMHDFVSAKCYLQNRLRRLILVHTGCIRNRILPPTVLPVRKGRLTTPLWSSHSPHYTHASTCGYGRKRHSSSNRTVP